MNLKDNKMNKIIELKKLFAANQIDSYIIPTHDQYLNEDVPLKYQRLKYLTNFSGSNGLALITKTDNILFTDGRYLLQAKTELALDFQIIEYSEANLLVYLARCRTIGFDPKLHTIKQIIHFITKQKNWQLKAVDQNLVDLLWKKKPETLNSIFIHDIMYTGQSIDFKVKNITQQLKQEDIDAIIITAPDSICWLLNLRGNSAIYTPIILGYLLVFQDGSMLLFLETQPSTEIKSYLRKRYVKIALMSDLANEISVLVKKKVQASPNSPFWIYQLFPQLVLKEDPCQLLKACKNSVEIKGAIEAHLKDGVAVTEFLCWLEQNYLEQQISELSAGEKLLQYRQQQLHFVHPSFSTIMGFAENGAVIHYLPNVQSNKIITGNNLLLIDSGGQYYDGTTDVTRVVAIGKPTTEQIHNYTIVLKCHIWLASATFPVGTSGMQLDSLARIELWQEGKDYAHGTGHGVGSFLAVHEGPQRISKTASNLALQAGMILSVEPGYYQEGAYGIRIENLVYVIQSQYHNFLCFRPLTKVPFAPELIDFTILTTYEYEWLKNYHQDVLGSLEEFLQPDTKIWLKQKILQFSMC